MFWPHRLLPFFLALIIETAAGLVQHGHLESLLEFRILPNLRTQNLRIPDIAQNIPKFQAATTSIRLSSPCLLRREPVSPGQPCRDRRPTPRSVLCEANVCVMKGDAKTDIGPRYCTADSSTRALAFWVTELCTLYQPLKELVTSRIGHASSGPLISYSMPTEWTRNPASTRSSQNRTKCALHYHPRKFSNTWDLPLRYERYFAFWDARPIPDAGCLTLSGTVPRRAAGLGRRNGRWN